MIRELKESYSYKKVMLTLSIASLISGIAFSFFGEFLLPFATSFYAALILFENPKQRFLSYIIPLINLASAVLVNGIFGLITLEYVLLALILFFVYYRLGSKAECALYMTILASFFVILSLYLGGVRATGEFSFSAITEYYSNFYAAIKERFTEFILSIQSESVQQSEMLNEETLSQYFNLLADMAVSLIGIFAFLISGVAIKVFVSLVLKYSKNGIYKSFLHFLPSRTAAYTYLIAAIIYVLSNSDSLLALSIFNAYEILMFVFAYVGLRFIYLLSKIQDKKTLLFLIIAGFFLMTGLTIQILSYLGVWIALSTNKNIAPPSEKH